MKGLTVSKLLGFIVICLFIAVNTATADGEWATSGANIFNTNTANVGIGTNDPQQKLHLNNGSMQIDNGSLLLNQGSFYLHGPTTGASRMYLVSGNDFTNATYFNRYSSECTSGPANSFIVEHKVNGNWVGSFELNNLGDFIINGNMLSVKKDSGNVGIGTTNPACKLDVRYSAAATDPFRIYDERVPATERGGYLDLGGYSDNPTTTITSYARLKSGKANAISGDTKGIFTISTDNGSGLMEALRVDSSGNLGVGTANPGARLVVNGDDTASAKLRVSSDNARLMEVTDASSGAIHYGILSLFDNNNAAGIYLYANPGGSSYIMSNLGIGTTNPQSTLAVNGTITAKKVKVTEVGWSDFVFADGYKLPSLTAVEDHIKKHKHLPGIPSAAEIQKKGLDVSDVLAKQMQKIEELTLYVIELQKQIEELKKR